MGERQSPSNVRHPATRCMRRNSLFIKKASSEEVVRLGLPGTGSRLIMINEGEKVHRLLLTSNVEVEYVGMVSPSCIWLKLFNHVTNEYDMRTAPFRIVQALKYENQRPVKSSIRLYAYYMAPRIFNDADFKELMYSRARLIEIKEKTHKGKPYLLCYVFYIDHGYGTWLLADCLSEMPKKFMYVPWQIIPVSLMGVSPPAEDDFGRVKSDAKWTNEQCLILRSILQRTKRFMAKPYVRKSQTLSYEHYARVELEAIRQPGDHTDDKLSTVEDKENIGDNQSNATPENDSSDAFIPSTTSVQYEFYFECKLAGKPIHLRPECEELSEQFLFGIEEKKNEDPEIPEPNVDDILRVEEYCHFPDPSRVDSSKTPEELQAERRKRLNEKHTRDTERRAGFKDDDDDFGVDSEEAELARKEAEEKAKEEEARQELLKWDPEITDPTITHQVEPVDEEYLRREGFLHDNDIFVLLNPLSRKSPYNFYGRLIRPCANPTKRSSRAAWCQRMISELEEFDKWQAELNDFYYVSANCKRLNADDIDASIQQKNINVYGIIRITDRLEQSHYVRVKVVGFVSREDRSNHISQCFVRLIDSGEMRTVNQDTILRLHSKHAAERPKAIAMCLPELVPYTNKNEGKNETDGSNEIAILEEVWSLEERDFFRRATCTDRPMKCELVRIHDIDKTTSIYNGPPVHLLPETYHVRNLYVLPLEKQPLSVDEAIRHEQAVARQKDRTGIA